MGDALIDLNASLREVCIFRTRVPRWIRQKSSDVLPCITTQTSAMSLTATDAAQIAFIALSLEGRSALRCEPTRTIGTGVSIMNDSAAAVYPMVSVPCVTITPSTPFSISSAMARASSTQYSARMFSERML
uniref:Uncharacterized protein n=1 Tax=Candidatus Methanogaster sp. ANME-2c ERB4 TaxID=2759911 RepID=A0A7G9Y064_9EURY|nr:hypothetical protein CMFFALLN_00001 [Methanosarcinales archaeon ANME-2c ERB4]